MLFSKKSMWLVAALSVCFIATNTSLASNDGGGQNTTTVNCHRGGASVQSAIDAIQFGQDTTVFIKGFCDESVSIVKDGITLSGNKGGGQHIGGGLTEVKVKGAQRVRIEFLELTGAGYGVLVEEGASVDIVKNKSTIIPGVMVLASLTRDLHVSSSISLLVMDALHTSRPG